MSGHSMTIDLEDGASWPSSYTVTCNEPPEAICRAQWDCDCEYWADQGVDERGPWHELCDGYMTDEDHAAATSPRHYGKPGGICGYRLWVENCDDPGELGSGEVTFPITFSWNGGDYEWEAVS